MCVLLNVNDGVSTENNRYNEKCVRRSDGNGKHHRRTVTAKGICEFVVGTLSIGLRLLIMTRFSTTHTSTFSHMSEPWFKVNGCDRSKQTQSVNLISVNFNIFQVFVTSSPSAKRQCF